MRKSCRAAVPCVRPGVRSDQSRTTLVVRRGYAIGSMRDDVRRATIAIMESPHQVHTLAPSTGRAFLADAALAMGLTVFSWLQVSMRPMFVLRGLPIPLRGGRIFFHFGPTLLTYALIAFCFLPLALRRRFPGPVLVTTTLAAAMYMWVPNPPALTVVGVFIALYTAGTLMDRRTFLAWGAPAVLLVLFTSVPAPRSEMFWPDLVRTLAVLLTAALLGDAERNRRAYVSEFERRALEAEHGREEEARRRVDEERLRIARELHDVTAHSLSVIAVQSGAAAHVLDSNPEEARRALVAIRDTSRAALQELRAMLGVLRGSEDDSAAPLAPAPGLAHLSELVKPLENAGHHVEVSVEGDTTDVPALVDASAYRIVQEALTNTLRHAGDASVRIAIARDPAALRIEVTDDGVSSGVVREGHGIAGMRERAEALGGSLEAGPIPGGGWRVSARLPVTMRQQ